MMPMTPNNALYLVKQHNQDLLREAEADRLYNEAKRGSAHLTMGLLAPLHAAMAAIARIGQQAVPESVKPVEKAQSGAALPVAKSVAN
jgi:hypothetical protein